MTEEYEEIKDQQEEEHQEEQEEQPEGEAEGGEVEAPAAEAKQEEPEEEHDTKDDEWGGADEEREVRREKKKNRGRDDVGKLYRRIQEEQAEKARILQEAEELRQQAAYYKSLTDQAQTALTVEHQMSADQFYLRAEKEYQEAYESQDVEAITKATAKLMDAGMRKQKADEIKIQHEYRLQQQQQQLAYEQQMQANNPKVVNRVHMQMWNIANPWANEKDPENYNPLLARYAEARGNELLEWARNTPGVHPLWQFSPEFFSEIDSYMKQVKEHLNQQAKKQPPTNKPKGNPAPVRGSSYPSGNAREPLTAHDRSLLEKMKSRMPVLTDKHFESGKRRALEQEKRARSMGQGLISTGGTI